ncbi:ATP-binding cassette domain-containing protein [Agaribacter flavus]|uniref:ATP-binding cassette domain-containing protein n=1 Tax=Agaribacter flavus TaxID=1902781 RepID=A0ABV7FR22_9ALTE
MYELLQVNIQRGDKHLLQHFDLYFRPQKITAIIGANGAGKSTLFKALLGDIAIDSGTISFAGKAIQQWSLDSLSRHRAYIAQSFRPVFAMPVYEYLLLAREPYTESEKHSERLIFDVANDIGIQHKLFTCITQLSGGEFQLVEFARAWLQLSENKDMSGKCLMLDEPSSALDIYQSQQLYRHILRFKDAGGTALIIDHDVNAVAKLADDLVMINAGALQTFGTAEDVFTAENINHCFNTQGHIYQHAYQLSYS